MSVELNHTIGFATDRQASAEFLAGSSVSPSRCVGNRSCPSHSNG